MAILGIAACHSAPPPPSNELDWRPISAELPAKWRERTLYSGPRAFVLASSESGAAQVHEVAQIADSAFFAVLGRHAASGLIIAVATEDPLLIENPEELIGTAQRWNAEATGREPPRRSHRKSSKRRRDEIPPELAARVLAVGIPKDEATLSLPARLRENIAHVVMLPTTACLESTCAQIFDVAVERKGLSWIQRALIHSVGDTPATEMVKMMQDQALATLLDVWISVEHVPTAEADAIFERAGVAGVLPERQGMETPQMEPETEAR